MAEAARLPLYIQIAEMLIREIAAGHLPEGTRLPAERDMAAELGISVGTLRKALAELDRKGLLARVQGSGNYVKASGPVDSVYAFFRLELAGGGGLPTARVLDVARLDKPAGLPAFGASGQAHRIRRLRLLGGQPAAVEEIWLDAARADRVAAADLSESLYLFYRQSLGFWIAAVEDRIGLDALPGWRPPEFPHPPGTLCGHVERRSTANDGQVAEVSRTWFDASTTRYVSRFT